MKIKGLLFLLLVGMVSGTQVAIADGDLTLLECLFGRKYQTTLAGLTRKQLDERFRQFSEGAYALASTQEEQIAMSRFVLGLSRFLRRGHERGMLERYGAIVEQTKKDLREEVVLGVPGHEIVRSRHERAQRLWWKRARELRV